MRITVDTSHDSHDEIKKVIKMLQHLVGDNQEVFTNQPQAASPMANIFGDATQYAPAVEAASNSAAEPSQNAEANETGSNEDLFAELFSEEELKKMDAAPKEVEKPAKGKKFNIEFY